MKAFILPIVAIVGILLLAAVAPACDGVQAINGGCHVQALQQRAVVQPYAVQQFVLPQAVYVAPQAIVQKQVVQKVVVPQRVVQKQVVQRVVTPRTVTRQRIVVRSR